MRLNRNTILLALKGYYFKLKFFLIGIAVAGLEEFITQGVLKDRPFGWIVPTLIAFGPFLGVMRLAGVLYDRRLAPARATALYYLTAGATGLALEWSMMGLAPWKNPSPLQIVFQSGMFSFWGTVAMAPRFLLDNRPAVGIVRRQFRWALITGFAFVYILTFISPKEARFPVAIGAVLLVFLSLNVFYFAYVRAFRSIPRSVDGTN